MCRANSKSTPAQRLDGRAKNPAKFLFRTSPGRFDLQSDREGSSNKKRPSRREPVRALREASTNQLCIFL
ncbi:hypothetical protein E4U43_000713, partial [Claviceps pusilla]